MCNAKIVVVGSSVYSDWHRLHFFVEGADFCVAITNGSGSFVHRVGCFDSSVPLSVYDSFPDLVARELNNTGHVSLDSLFDRVIDTVVSDPWR